MKKYYVAILFLLITRSAIAQFSSDGFFDGRFGITAGVTNYYMNTDFLFSKSGVGYTVGLVGTASFSERSELFAEITYSKHFVSFICLLYTSPSPRD